MNIADIFENVPDVEVSSIMTDSRVALPAAIFFCVKGMVHDGHDYVDQAIENGAVVVVHSDPLKEYRQGVTYLQVEDTLSTLNDFTAAFYGSVTNKMMMFGVTGTNGKTITSSIIDYLANNFGKSGYIGTIGYRVNDELVKMPLNTPEVSFLHQSFLQMYQNGCQSATMEVSSYELELHRVDSIDFDYLVFTNLQHDHLDFHGTFENYYRCKASLFEKCDSSKTAIINIDDPYGVRLMSDSNADNKSISLEKAADYTATHIQIFADHTEFDLIHENQCYPVYTNLVARFNVYNLLAAIAALHEAGYSLENIIPLCRNIPQLSGRTEMVSEGQPFNCIIDSAHTVEGFEKIYEFANAITPADKRILAVFGAAGERDTKKRPDLGKISDQNCKVMILTSEDPRMDDPAKIAEEIQSGISENASYYIEDRYAAIRQICELANDGDCVVVLGKGNETFMFNGKSKQPWMGDVNAVKEVLKELYGEEDYETE